MFETSDKEIDTDGKNNCSNGRINININNNNNDEIVVNNNYELKFPYSIKSVDPDIDEQLLKDFTGIYKLQLNGNSIIIIIIIVLECWWSTLGVIYSPCFLFVYEFREILCAR